MKLTGFDAFENRNVMLLIKYSSKFKQEKKHTIHVVFTEWLGIEYSAVVDNSLDGISITLPNQQVLALNSSFWNECYSEDFSEIILPTPVWSKCAYTDEDFTPILFGDNKVHIENNVTKIGIDIIGTCFFMLSRVEEAVITKRDNHQRFPATESIAYKNGFLERPIVDEYVEMLWNILISLDSSLLRKELDAKTFVTCDVDWPFDPIRHSFKHSFKHSLGNLIKRRSLKLFIDTWKRYFYRVFNFKQEDSYRDAINWMMEVNEEAGNKVAFYFIPLNTSPLDSDFCFDSKKMRGLFRDIASRGHEIGLHPGYECFNNPELFYKSANVLKKALAEESIEQPLIGGRMHYLRWDILTTPQLWDNNGFDYDSTLGFADSSGFRCGTSREFTMFDLINKKPFKLKQRPLINMECTIISERYESLGYTDLTRKRFEIFKKLSQKFNGTYTLLWHNSHFTALRDKELYRELIK